MTDTSVRDDPSRRSVRECVRIRRRGRRLRWSGWVRFGSAVLVSWVPVGRHARGCGFPCAGLGVWRRCGRSLRALVRREPALCCLGAVRQRSPRQIVCRARSGPGVVWSGVGRAYTFAGFPETGKPDRTISCQSWPSTDRRRSRGEKPSTVDGPTWLGHTISEGRPLERHDPAWQPARSHDHPRSRPISTATLHERIGRLDFATRDRIPRQVALVAVARARDQG